jgi:sigma-B regulation protein RsbU (phosphoserine phosphatase)
MKAAPGDQSELSNHQVPRYQLHARLRIIAVIITVALFAIEVLIAAKVPSQPYSGIVTRNVTVSRVAEGSPAQLAGVKVGDHIQSVNGVACVNMKEASECLAEARPGDTVVYEVMREGRVFTVPVKFGKQPTGEIVRKLLLVLVGLSFILIGLVVYFKRADRVALVFYLFCVAFGLLLANIVSYEVGAARYLYKAILYDVMVLFLPAFLLHFFLVFPERKAILRRFPRLEASLYIPAVIFLIFSEFFNIMVFRRGMSYSRSLMIFESITAVYFVVYFILGLVSFFHSYRMTPTRAVKRKLRLVVWGTVAGTLPLVAIFLLVSLRPETDIPGQKFAVFPLILIPVTFGHAIVRYGLFDVTIVIRRSLVYTILTAILASVYFVVVYGIGRLAAQFIGRADLLFSVISIFAITLLFSPLRRKISAAIDRVFFKEDYNYRKILKRITHSISGMLSLDSLCSYLSIRVPEVLHASAGAVYLYDETLGDFHAICAANLDTRLLNRFEPAGSLSRHLTRTEATFNLERTRASNRPIDLTADELQSLTRAGVSLVTPFILKSKLLGFLALGPKLSDEFYSSRDIELLETLCDHVAMAVENARLYRETTEKQRMERELEVARRIQQMLLPKTFPRVRGLETQAMNRPSEQVGGDYYDILHLSENRVGIAIADVSGKGVPAALLMASLQSSLRAEAGPGKTPSEVIQALNRVVCEQTSGETFVTIFYGLLDLEQRKLHYCNAGQTPPFVVGADGRVRRLDITHLVIGVDREAFYEDTILDLEEGDLLFLYTDGITEEIGPDDDLYGEERLTDRLIESYDVPLPEVLEIIHSDVVRHGNGKPHDDLTALALKIKAFPVPSPQPTWTPKKG